MFNVTKKQNKKQTNEGLKWYQEKSKIKIYKRYYKNKKWLIIVTQVFIYLSRYPHPTSKRDDLEDSKGVDRSIEDTTL